MNHRKPSIDTSCPHETTELCFAHDGYCCACGRHDMTRADWQRHRAHDHTNGSES